MVWDEENRLRGINDNGRLHLYTYDHTGERALKSSAESSLAVINGLASAVITHTEDYTAYVSPYFVVNKGKFTKHYFEGSSRVVSKLGEGTFSHKNTGIMAGGIDYIAQSAQVQTAIDQYVRGLQVPPGPPTQHGIYATPEWTGEAYPSVDWQSISQNQEPPQGWPRPPKFNELGDVPGPPVQFGPPVTNANVKAGHGFIPNGVEEKNLYYYHPDHLGSSSYITDKNGEVIQHTEYMAFGETFVDEHSVSKTMPYLFNAKELDFETGLYYYGARYYDPKTSIWLNVDPLAEKYPEVSPYTYTLNNPIMLIDPDGRDIIGVTKKDAQNFQQDIYRVLSDKKFESVRALISIKGNKFNKIDGLALTKALENISVSTDEKTYIDIVVNTINSKEVHKVEYLSGDITSSEGASAFRDHMNNAQQGIGDMLLTPDGNLSSTLIDSQGGGLNVPTKKGSHSFISAMHKGDDRAITSGHELFGHGIPSAKKTDDKTNNSNAIRTDNLIRRLLGKPERDGSNHAGYNQGHITEPNQLPMTE